MTVALSSPTFSDVEIARAIAIDSTFSRRELGDSAGGIIEVHDDSPDELLQAKRTLEFIQQSLCYVTLENDGVTYSLGPKDTAVLYVHLKQSSDEDCRLEQGWRLTLVPSHRVQLTEDDVVRLRDAAYQAGLVILTNEGMPSVMLDSDDPFDWGPGVDRKGSPAAVARRIHQKLKGKRVETAFALSCMGATQLDFIDRFVGDEVSSEPGASATVNGLIYEVVYRGQTLSFKFDVKESTDAKLLGATLNIEYAPQQRELVHELAAFWQDTCAAEVMVQHRTDKSGSQTIIYSLTHLTPGAWSTAGRSEVDRSSPNTVMFPAFVGS